MGQNVIKGIIIGRIRRFKQGFKIPIISIFHEIHGRHQGFTGDEGFVLTLLEPFPEIGAGNHFGKPIVGGGHHLTAMGFNEMNEIMAHDLIIPDIEIPKNTHLGTTRFRLGFNVFKGFKGMGQGFFL